jgi:hypothetical protein
MIVEKSVMVDWGSYRFPCLLRVNTDAGSIQILKSEGFFADNVWEISLKDALDVLRRAGIIVLEKKEG